jgi:hypothetical protein
VFAREWTFGKSEFVQVWKVEFDDSDESVSARRGKYGEGIPTLIASFIDPPHQ